MKTPVLETERLILRPVTLEDAPAIQKYFNDWEIIKNLATHVPWPYPEDGALTFLRENMLPRMRDKGHLCWAIALKGGEGEAIGLIDFAMTRADHGDRGFWLARPFQGRGYMTEAINAMQDYLFFDLKIDRIVVCNSLANPGSRRVKEKTGAVYLGLCEIEHHSGGNVSQKWEVTRENWAKVRGRSV